MTSFDLPREIRHIIRTIVGAGEDAYVVGGTVRDTLLGNPGGDWDLATTALPKKVMGLFRRVVPTGIAHGTVTVLVGDQKAEITTLRGDGGYADGRRPSSVTFLTSIEADLARRDFTVNAMAWDPHREVLHDPFGGRQDLSDRVLRAVGEPDERFAEDGLRVLRAARFAATLGFDVDKRTLAAMPAAAPALVKVSAERKRDEISKMVCAPVPSRGLVVMDRGGLLGFVSEDLARLQGVDPGRRQGAEDAWQLTLSRVDAIQAVLHLRLAALLCDLATPGPIREEGPGEMGSGDRTSAMAREWLLNMRYERKLIDTVAHLGKEQKFDCKRPWRDPELRRFLARVGTDALDDIITLRRADDVASARTDAEVSALNGFVARIKKLTARGVVISLDGLAIDGRDLMTALNISPGPVVGDLLKALLEQVIEHPENNTKERLVELGRKLLENA
jgi:tRNA nucleotidyltransferase/poly(A) polymerase